MARKTTPNNVHWLSGAIRLFVSTERLPCPLTSDEWADRAEEAAKLHGLVEAGELAEKERRREAKVKHDALVAERDRLLAQVRTHEEVRAVEVAGHGVIESNEVVTVRLDTHAVIHRRAMDAEERERALQPDLPMGERLPPEAGDDDEDPNED